jgi:hypothetical protein
MGGDIVFGNLNGHCANSRGFQVNEVKEEERYARI